MTLLIRPWRGPARDRASATDRASAKGRAPTTDRTPTRGRAGAAASTDPLDVQAIRRHFAFPEHGRIVTNNVSAF